MKKSFIIFFLALNAVVASAQTAPALLIGADPAAYGRGGASVAAAADAFAVDNNTAAMSLSDKKFDIAATYGMWSPKAADNTLAGLGAFFRVNDKIAVGLSGRLLLDKPYDIATPYGRVTGTFTPKDIVAGLGVSYAVTDNISLGLTARMLASSIGEELSGNAFAGDLTAMYAKDAFSAALGVCNVGSALSYGGESYALPMFAKAGAAYSASGFTASAEVDYLFSGALMAGVGAEYCIVDIVSLRAGFHYGDAAKAIPTYASVGLGVKFAGVHLDAAYLLASKALGNTLTVSLGYAF